MPALITGWEVLDRLLDVQPRTLPVSTHMQFIQLLNPCFGLRHQSVVQLMCRVLRKLYQHHTLEEGPARAAEAYEVQKAIHSQLHNYLNAGMDAAQPLLVSLVANA